MAFLPIDKVRLNIGDTVAPYDLTDDVIECTLDEYVAKSEDLAIWYTTVQCLVWLKARYSKTSMRSRERVGGVDVETYGAERYKTVCDLLAYYKANPTVTSSEGSSLSMFSFAEGEPRIKINWRDEALAVHADEVPLGYYTSLQLDNL